MRLHTDTITPADIYTATRDLPGVYATITEHGSRSRKRAYEVRLEGNGYARNTGRHEADDYETGATWDEWGVVIARLFDIDPLALWGSAKYPVYQDAAHFHNVTGDRFHDGMPEDTHKRHVWDWDHGQATCKLCSAIYEPRI